MSKRGICHFTQPYYIGVSWQEKKIFSGRPYLHVFEVSRSIKLIVNQSTEFKDGAQTSLRKALFQNINKFLLFISYFSKKDTVKQEN